MLSRDHHARRLPERGDAYRDARPPPVLDEGAAHALEGAGRDRDFDAGLQEVGRYWNRPGFVDATDKMAHRLDFGFSDRGRVPIGTEDSRHAGGLQDRLDLAETEAREDRAGARRA